MKRTIAEAEYDFSKDAHEVLGKVGSLAKKAFLNLKQGHNAAKAEKQKQLNDKHAEDAAAADAAEKQAADELAAAEKQKRISASIAAGMGAAGVISNLVLEREDPVEQDLDAIQDFNKEDMQKFLSGIEQVQERFGKMLKHMRTALKNSDFLNQQDKNDHGIGVLLADLKDDKLPALAAKMVANEAGQIDLWKAVITSDDENALQRRYIQVLKTMSNIHEKKNLAVTGTGWTDASGKKRTLYTGSKLVELLRGEMQLVERRVALLKTFVENRLAKPITNEHLQALRDLLKRL